MGIFLPIPFYSFFLCFGRYHPWYLGYPQLQGVDDYHSLIKESIKSLHEKNFANHHAQTIDLTGGLYSTNFKTGKNIDICQELRDRTMYDIQSYP